MKFPIQKNIGIAPKEMSSVIGTRNLTLFPFPCSRTCDGTCDVSCTCRVSEISIPKPTMICFTMNHRLFIHNENYIIDM